MNIVQLGGFVQAFLHWDLLGALALEVGGPSSHQRPDGGGSDVKTAEVDVPCSFTSFAEYFCCWAPLLLRELQAEMAAEVALRAQEGRLQYRYEAVAAGCALDPELDAAGLSALVVSRRAVASGNANQVALGTRRRGGDDGAEQRAPGGGPLSTANALGQCTGGGGRQDGTARGRAGGNCYLCGKAGHLARDCRLQPVRFCV